MKKEHLPLYIGLALPILLVVAVAVAVYIPRAMANPQYDFVYAVDDPGRISPVGKSCTQYVVEEGSLTKGDVIEQYPHGWCFSPQITFYRFDISARESSVIPEETATGLSFSAGPLSPDGYRLVRDRSHNGVFEIFGGGNRNEWVLEKNSVRLPVMLAGADDYYYRDIQFIGWITN